ncbi:MAG: hypothetical protein Q9190_005993 [Brigantiaea leucoxantha]
MFDILEADIVVLQETKIQQKDLVDDMVLVPGWDCFWSFPKHKKGYSGVVIYTRQSTCVPIRAEEGITGRLCPPNSSTSFCNLPESQQIGGYPSQSQLDVSAVDAITLDSEGRCVILQFVAFILLGVYSPAQRDETRDDFRLGFLDVLDARIRNLISAGMRVILVGDLNISRDTMDSAYAEALMRKVGMSPGEHISTPARRMFNHLVQGGRVVGVRDKGRENPVMLDVCRHFHPVRTGMFTCWDQKVNARPGNYGSRIDYVLGSLEMKDWFEDSNIQEGLMGSDHCPVFATLKDRIMFGDHEFALQDYMHPLGVFIGGIREREDAPTDMLPMSGRLLPEFDGRRSIRDMFVKMPFSRILRSPVKPAALDASPATLDRKRVWAENSDPMSWSKRSKFASSGPMPAPAGQRQRQRQRQLDLKDLLNPQPSVTHDGAGPEETARLKRSKLAPFAAPVVQCDPKDLHQPQDSVTQETTRLKRSKLVPFAAPAVQCNLKDLLNPQPSKKFDLTALKEITGESSVQRDPKDLQRSGTQETTRLKRSKVAPSPVEWNLLTTTRPTDADDQTPQHQEDGMTTTTVLDTSTPPSTTPRLPRLMLTQPEEEQAAASPPQSQASADVKKGTTDTVHDPIQSQLTWSKVFAKPSAPRCEHGEMCVNMLTKKKGVNFGRSFWMCSRPLGPRGVKEKNTEWRCGTFIWSSDWDPLDSSSSS